MAYATLPHRAKDPASTQTADQVGPASITPGHSRGDKTDKPDKHDKIHEKSEPRQWAYISDTVVRLTTLDEVLKSKAYMCLYERIS